MIAAYLIGVPCFLVMLALLLGDELNTPREWFHALLLALCWPLCVLTAVVWGLSLLTAREGHDAT